MTRAAWVRLALTAVAILLLELLCRTGVIDNLTMPPPSVIIRDLVTLLASGKMNAAMMKTLWDVVTAFAAATISGVCLGVVIHGQQALRRGLEPLFATYYAVPVFAFYPLLIVLFGLGDTPQILIGYMLAVVSVIMNTMTGLDHVSRVLIKTARIHRLGPIDTALHPICSLACVLLWHTPSSASSAPSSLCRTLALATKSASPTTTSTMRPCIR
jgi:NitT/TauT family transport system permease protein